jgi:ferredoxin-NADP reductase
MRTVANWPTFMARLVERHEVAERTMAFQFEKLAGWSFKPGQFIDITLLTPPETDAEGNTRGFSISSAPHEPTIMITTRLRDTAFKRVLKTMSLESQVKIEGPFGNLSLHNNAARPAVFLAGGMQCSPIRVWMAMTSVMKSSAVIDLSHTEFRLM